MCCSRIRVTLNGVVKDKQGERAGTYQKASGLINNRSHWKKIDGDQSLWYDITANRWAIGKSSDRGSSSSLIDSVHDTACPTSDNLFKYYDSGEWPLAPINSVFIQCA